MTGRDPEIQALIDKKQIEEVILRYLRGADRGDADLIADCYHADAHEEHGGTFDGPASEYVALLRERLPLAGRMSHCATNILIDLNGDVARSECYCTTFSRRKDGDETFDSVTLARLVDRFEKREGHWKIAKRRLAWEWNHDMAFAETWARGQLTTTPEILVRGGRKPNDILYQD